MYTTALDQYTTHRANCERENSELRERERERWGGRGGERLRIEERAQNCVVVWPGAGGGGGEGERRREGKELCSVHTVTPVTRSFASR